MAGDLGRALEELVRREVEAALRRHGIGNRLVRGSERPEHEGISLSESSDYLRCPRCGYEIFLGSESWGGTATESESETTGTAVTEGEGEGESETVGYAESGAGETVGRSTTRSVGHSVGRSRSITEGRGETEAERMPKPDKMAAMKSMRVAGCRERGATIRDTYSLPGYCRRR